MNVQVGDVVGNIKTVLKHCIELGIGASILLSFFLLYGKPAFTEYQQKACFAMNYLGGKILKLLLFLIASYVVWIIAKVIFDPIPWPFKDSLEGVTIGDALVILKYLAKEENILIKEELDSIEYGNSIIRKVGTGSFAILLLLIVAFIISCKTILLIPIGFSGALLAICAVLHHKTFRYQATFMKSIRIMIHE